MIRKLFEFIIALQQCPDVYNNALTFQALVFFSPQNTQIFSSYEVLMILKLINFLVVLSLIYVV